MVVTKAGIDVRRPFVLELAGNLIGRARPVRAEPPPKLNTPAFSEVTFLQQDRSSDTPKEIVKGTFEFEAGEMARTEVTANPAAPQAAASPGARSVSTPGYIWALVLFMAGIALGKFSSRIYKWAFS